MSFDPPQEAAVAAVMQMLTEGQVVSKDTVRPVAGALKNDLLGAIIKEAKRRRKDGVSLPSPAGAAVVATSDDDRAAATLSAMVTRLLNEARADERRRAERQIAFEREQTMAALAKNGELREKVQVLEASVRRLGKDLRDTRKLVRDTARQMDTTRVLIATTQRLEHMVAAASAPVPAS